MDNQKIKSSNVFLHFNRRSKMESQELSKEKEVIFEEKVDRMINEIDEQFKLIDPTMTRDQVAIGFILQKIAGLQMCVEELAKKSSRVNPFERMI